MHRFSNCESWSEFEVRLSLSTGRAQTNKQTKKNGNKSVTVDGSALVQIKALVETPGVTDEIK